MHKSGGIKNINKTARVSIKLYLVNFTAGICAGKSVKKEELEDSKFNFNIRLQ